MKIVRNVILSFGLTCCLSYGYPFKSIEQDKRPVSVKDWGRVVMMMTDEGWSNAERELTAQVTASELNAIKNHYSYKSIPPEMSLFMGENRKNKKKFYEKLSNLKVIKIADFTHVLGNKSFGQYAILKVPYKGNEQWDPNVKWDSIYFVINKEGLQ